MIVLLAIRRALGRWSFFRRRFNTKSDPIARGSKAEHFVAPGSPTSTRSASSSTSTDTISQEELAAVRQSRRELKTRIGAPQFKGASNLVDDTPARVKRRGRVFSMASIASFAAAADSPLGMNPPDDDDDDDMAIQPIRRQSQMNRRQSLMIEDSMNQAGQRQSILIGVLKSERRAKRGRSIKRVSWFDGQDGDCEEEDVPDMPQVRYESPKRIVSIAEWEEVDESEVMDWEGMEFMRGFISKENGGRRPSLPTLPESRRASFLSEA
ncbi:hypothetical protein K491DRAFT_385393 [Lophiostoma macrostomum CBS 122681]|uniref:Uncharacterized protein n=1 Tax=Lophiostoma macrostomum CBS 122681 TaxID=1314788 RepID=A0A6A6TR19_9PLEO|nr:hypothetical protein K491DRAFT_385393 [Lophiostoma macrostomum CBS 122681]